MKKSIIPPPLNLQHKKLILESKNYELGKPIAGEYFLNLYEQIIQNSRDVLYCINFSEFEIVYISPSIVELSGYSIEEIMQRDNNELLQIIHPNDRELIINHFQNLQLETSQKNQTIEFRIKPKRGIYRWVNDNHILIFDPIENTHKIIGNVHDITDLKLVENALKRSRDRLHLAIEATNDGMWDWRMDTNRVYFDLRFYTMMGYEPNEFPGSFEEWMKHIHPEDISLVKENLNNFLIENSGQWRIEYRFLAKNGSYIWVLNRGKIFDWDENDNPLRMVGTHTDISLRKSAELALIQKNRELIEVEEQINDANKELIILNNELNLRNIELEEIFNQLQTSEEKFRQLAENTEDIFWLMDENEILYINPAFEKIWGRSRKQVIQNPAILAKWIHPDDIHHINTYLPSYLSQIEKPENGKYRLIKPDGEIRWLWVRSFPILSPDGNIYRVAGIATDITEQKRIEEALIAAKEKAMESDNLKSTFLANISHEIRTPMNGIIGFTNLLKDKAHSPEIRDQFIELISQSSARLLHVIEDIVDISKIEANQLILKNENIHIYDLLEEVYENFMEDPQYINKNHLEFIVEYNNIDRNCIIKVDYDRIKQVLYKIISNAFKFTDDGFVIFGCKIISSKTLEFYVKDSGIGISDDYQVNLFKQFRQADESFTRKFGGTGLGLAICQGIISRYGGEIWADSVPNNGATFYFTLPDVLITSPELKSFVQPEGAIKTYDWSTHTILIVEDDLINQEYFKVILSPTQINIIFAFTGEESVKICSENNDIDLVLMDIRLPIMSGFDALEEIQKIQPQLPVIAQTAFAMPDDAIQCKKAGFSDFISKPINKSTLFSILERFLD